MKEMRR